MVGVMRVKVKDGPLRTLERRVKDITELNSSRMLDGPGASWLEGEVNDGNDAVYLCFIIGA